MQGFAGARPDLHGGRMTDTTPISQQAQEHIKAAIARHKHRNSAPGRMERTVEVRVGDRFTIQGATFQVTYINHAKKTFTSKQVIGIVRTHPGGPPCVKQS